jgi:hypothetical protein
MLASIRRSYILCVAMADGHHILLLWLYILRLCLPSILFVSVLSPLPNK